MGSSNIQTYLMSRGARVQFAIGVALISVIPLLVFWYFNVNAEGGASVNGFQNLIVLMLLTSAAVGGSTMAVCTGTGAAAKRQMTTAVTTTTTPSHHHRRRRNGPRV